MARSQLMKSVDLQSSKRQLVNSLKTRNENGMSNTVLEDRHSFRQLITTCEKTLEANHIAPNQ